MTTGNITPIRRPIRIGAVETPKKNRNAGKTGASNTNFSDILRQLQEKDSKELKFSNHALVRLSQRDIHLDGSDLRKLSNAVTKAEGKGARDSLVLLQKPEKGMLAFLVNIPNKTVITAVEQEAATEHTFTNIDSAVIV